MLERPVNETADTRAEQGSDIRQPDADVWTKSPDRSGEPCWNANYRVGYRRPADAISGARRPPSTRPGRPQSGMLVSSCANKEWQMPLGELVPIVVVLVILVADLWVYTDAKAHAEIGDPVALSVGTIQLDSPEAWAVVCVLLSVLCFPLYFASRNHPG
jgi:hypothetical protein